MEFELMWICIGPSPLVYLIRLISIAATTIPLMIFVNRIISQSYTVSKLKLILLLIPILISALIPQILFKLIFHLFGDARICTYFVRPTPLESCIPLFGGLFILFRRSDRRICKILHFLFRFIFFAAISLSLYY